MLSNRSACRADGEEPAELEGEPELLCVLTDLVLRLKRFVKNDRVWLYDYGPTGRSDHVSNQPEFRALPYPQRVCPSAHLPR